MKDEVIVIVKRSVAHKSKNIDSFCIQLAISISKVEVVRNAIDIRYTVINTAKPVRFNTFSQFIAKEMIAFDGESIASWERNADGK